MAVPVVGKKLVRSKSGLKIVAASDDLANPFLVPEPIWVPDNQCKECMECKCRFDFMKRRHHCRRCGECFCHSCCDTKLPLPRMCFIDPVRLCSGCVKVTVKENEFFEKHIRTLTNGAFFNIHGFENGNMEGSWVCRLSSDHRWLKFECEKSQELDDIDLMQIDSAQIQTSGTDAQGNVVASGITIKYQSSCGESLSVSLHADDSTNKKQSIMWIVAMQKALKLIFETRGKTSPAVVNSERRLN